MSVNEEEVPEILTPADARRSKERRGTGSQADYLPWIYIHEVSSKGRKHLLPGYMTKRNHHLLSDGEAACTAVLEWHSAVIDIREQFPLLPLKSTIALAEHLGIKHPTDPKNNAKPFVLTVDFVITTSSDNRTPLQVISFKRAAQLNHKATLLRQELERRYLEEYGLEDRAVTWSLVTEHELPQILIKNIAHLSPRTFRRMRQEQVAQIKDELERQWHPASPLTALSEKVDRDLTLELGTALSIVRQLIYHGLWVFNLRDQLFKVNHPLDDLIIDQDVKLPPWSILP
jgi:hypothetical protein